MSIGDKAKDVIQQGVGKVEEAVGTRTDDQEQVEQGRKDQAMGADRLEAEKAKD